MKAKPLTGDALKKLDEDSSLPQKDGKRNDENYNKWADNSLRKRLWDRMLTKKCIRCDSSSHLRSACPEKRQAWEDDFDVGPSFWNPKQARSQWIHDGPQSSLLHLKFAHGLIALDSCSDVSMASVDILTNVRECPPIFLNHLGGTSRFDQCGEVCLDNTTITVFAVSNDNCCQDFLCSSACHF